MGNRKEKKINIELQHTKDCEILNSRLVNISDTPRARRIMLTKEYKIDSFKNL